MAISSAPGADDRMASQVDGGAGEGARRPIGFFGRLAFMLWGDADLHRAGRREQQSAEKAAARQPQEALALQEEAVVLLRRFVAGLPEYRHRLASALVTLGHRQA